MNTPAKSPASGATRQAWRLLIGPFLLYLVGFVALTWPHVLTFRTDIWTGPGDGLQMVWNIWWVDKALTDLIQSPWRTTFLHFPDGVGLYVHTMHPLKGIMAIPLLRLFSLGETYNLLIIYSFAFTGVTAFWLAHALSRAYWPSLVGGAVFTFCNYHFAHAQGHMQLVSMEWIPVFILLWYRLLLNPRMRTAVAAALVLGLVLLCDHYYFMYSVIAGGLMVIWKAVHDRRLLFMVRAPYRAPLLTFVALCAVTSGILLVATLRFMRQEENPFIFDSNDFSMDLLGLLIPGWHWRFSDLTAWYWTRQPGKVHGQSVHLGLAVLSLAAYAVIRRRRLPDAAVGLWVTLGAFFAVMALGLRLRIAGWVVPYLGDWEVPLLRMPYTLMVRLIPGLEVGARPGRMVVMTTLAAAVLVPLALKLLWAGGRRARLVAAGLLILMLVEFMPRGLPAFRTEVPDYVHDLAARPDGGALYDGLTRQPLSMYFQTIHEHPLAFGYISRAYLSMFHHRVAKEERYNAGDFGGLRDDFGFRYLLVPAGTDVPARCPEAVRVRAQEDVWLYDLGPRQPVPAETSENEELQHDS